MSNESGKTPERDPFAAPDDDATPVDATRPLPPPPSGYEAVPPAAPAAPAAPEAPGPAASSAPVPPYGAPGAPGAPAYGAPAGQTPYGAPGQAGPTPYGAAGQTPYGAPSQAGPGPYGAPGQAGQPGQPGQPPYGAAGQPPYGAPGQPPYGQQGQPPYGQAPYGGPGYGVPAPPTDGLAVASFATSTGGLLLTGGLVSPVGLGLGIAALRRIKRTGNGGRPWAIAGIVIGIVGTLSILVIAGLTIAFVVAASNSDEFATSLEQLGEDLEQDLATPDDLASPDDSFSDDLGYYVLRDDIAVGQCLDAYPMQYDMSDVTVVPCADLHDTEVVATVELEDAILDEESSPAYTAALDACGAAIDAAAPGLLAQGGFAEVYYAHPDDFTSPGGSTALCTYTSDGFDLTGSIVAGDLLVGGQAVGS
ncbi:DUF4190 domain-containing protein [Cellulomonas biazotea]|uniref:DUF4190 domain-containing protein n=1 Tax=Cellulomonas biazotea TaxID=1709 RepID=A0A402DLF8_9CELL|nr:DUF4190 domain-containing protein [Cellulomonas biazotea]GCE74953.1 hypothetical protein CBZ_00090 [Cellulomonas biazotea]